MAESFTTVSLESGTVSVGVCLLSDPSRSDGELESAVPYSEHSHIVGPGQGRGVPGG